MNRAAPVNERLTIDCCRCKRTQERPVENSRTVCESCRAGLLVNSKTSTFKLARGTAYAGVDVPEVDEIFFVVHGRLPDANDQAEMARMRVEKKRQARMIKAQGITGNRLLDL